MKVKEAIKQNSPEILTGIGVAGIFISIFLAIDATKKSEKAIEEKKKELGTEELPLRERVLTAGKYYCWTAFVAAGSATALIFADRIHLSRETAMVTSIMIGEKTIEELKSFKEKAKEELGEKKTEKIENEVQQEQYKKHNVASTAALPICGRIGNVRCSQNITWEPFMSDHETVRAKINDLNDEFNRTGEVRVNEFLRAFGLKEVPWGEDAKWKDRPLDPRYQAILDETGTPCLLIDFDVDDYFDRRRY